MTKRRPMTKARRVRIFDAAHGVCHLCNQPIQTGEAWDAEHVIALTCGGTDDDANIRPAHVDCHAGKTRSDKRDGAKITRIRARVIGARMPKARIASPPKPVKASRDKLPLPPRRPMWITTANPRGTD